MERNVPKLRFKGFSDEWTKYKAENLFENISDKNHNGELNVLSVTQDKGVVLRSELDIDIKFDINSLKSYKKVKDGDFIISLRSFQGGIETSNQVGLISPAYTVFNFNEKNKFNTKFMGYIFKSENFIRKMSGLIYGIRDGKAISFKDFSTMNFKIPSLQEQERIANFLTKVDKIIEKQEEKVKNLENYKKGMMQKIFSQEIRFKDENGNEYPEWKEKRLQDISFKITEKNKGFKIKNIISNSAKNGLISQRDFFDKDIANISNIDGYYVIKPGDFVYNPRKSCEAPYGPINSYKLDSEGLVSPLYFCFRINEKVNKVYIEYYFKSTKWHKYIYMNSDQGVRHDRVSIKDSEIMRMNIELPVIEEQNKIVKFLLGVNGLLDKEKEKLEELKEWKKGLLQQMFV